VERYLTYKDPTNWITLTNTGVGGNHVIERSVITQFTQSSNGHSIILRVYVPEASVEDSCRSRAARSAMASWRSAVSKPSVNHT
jgi:hypothetical protein